MAFEGHEEVPQRGKRVRSQRFDGDGLHLRLEFEHRAAQGQGVNPHGTLMRGRRTYSGRQQQTAAAAVVEEVNEITKRGE